MVQARKTDFENIDGTGRALVLQVSPLFHRSTRLSHVVSIGLLARQVTVVKFMTSLSSDMYQMYQVAFHSRNSRLSSKNMHLPECYMSGRQTSDSVDRYREKAEYSCYEEKNPI